MVESSISSPPRAVTLVSVCTFEGCDRPLGEKGGKSQGLCSGHYQQLVRGKPLAPLQAKRPKGAGRGVCTFPECGREAFARGLCAGHNRQRRLGKDLTPLSVKAKPSAMTKDLPCDYLGCENTQYAKGLCAGHYEQQRSGRSLAPLRKATRP